MAATLAVYDAALKRIWTQERLEEQLYQDTPFLSRIQKSTRHTVGETARVPLHTGRNGGYTALPEGGGTLNTAGNQVINKAEYNYTHHHQQIRIQGDAIDGASSNKHSVANVVNTEVEGALTDLKRQIQRQLFLNGDALIAQCRASDSNNVDLNTTSGKAAIDRGWIFVGMPVDVGTTASEATILDGDTVASVDETLYAFDPTTAGNITTEDTTHYVSVKDARSATTSYESNGLQNIVDATATVGGLAPASEPRWKAAWDNTTSQALTLSLLLQGDQKIHQRTGRKSNFVLFGLEQERRFYELLQQQVRYSSDSSLTAGSQETVKWKGMEIFCDPDCQDTFAYMGQLEHLFIVALDKPYWVNKHDGGTILKWVQGSDSYGSKLTYRFNLATNRREGFVKFTALTAT
jgi:hypothetical protein